MRNLPWPTLVVGLVIYTSFFVLTFWWVHIPIPLLFLVGGIITAWYASLEHEVIHGHPTRWPWLNRLFVLPPLLLWLPFEVYAQTHRQHHRDETLTDPFDDPESYYIAQDRWDALWPWQQRILLACNTLLGRLTLGVPVSIFVFWKHEAAMIARGEAGRRGMWARHILLTAGLLD